MFLPNEKPRCRPVIPEILNQRRIRLSWQFCERDLFGTVKTWHFRKVVRVPQRLGIKRSRFESPGLFPFLGCLILCGRCELNFLLGMPPARVLCWFGECIFPVILVIGKACSAYLELNARCKPQSSESKSYNLQVVVSNIFWFSPLFGEDSQFDFLDGNSGCWKHGQLRKKISSPTTQPIPIQPPSNAIRLVIFVLSKISTSARFGSKILED